MMIDGEMNSERKIKRKEVKFKKPMVITHQRRNPFKRNSAVGASTPGTKTSSNNPLSHLTEKAIGFDRRKSSQHDDGGEHDSGAGPSGVNVKGKTIEGGSNATQDMDFGESQDTEVIPSSINNENKAQNEQTSTAPAKGSFMVWFKANKEDLKTKHPDVTPQELTKLAMKEYKAISLSNSVAISNGDTGNDIAKETSAPADAKQVNGKRKLDDTTSERQSGIAKLARFGFKK